MAGAAVSDAQTILTISESCYVYSHAFNVEVFGNTTRVQTTDNFIPPSSQHILVDCPNAFRNMSLGSLWNIRKKKIKFTGMWQRT